MVVGEKRDFLLPTSSAAILADGHANATTTARRGQDFPSSSSSSFFFFLPLLLLDTSLLRLLLLLLLLLQPPFNQSSICIVFFSLHRFYFDLFRPLDVFIYKCECLPPVFSFPGIYFLHFFISLFDIADFGNDHYWLR